ncbi:MAG: FAD:protein FMN transferase [Pirellulales bacterium]|nr:FAD:protein FMN transferase [Pirellulales bacterium]
MTRNANRREFLKGKAAMETLSDAIPPDAAAENSGYRASESPTVHVTRRAMATEFELRFPDDPQKNLTELALESFAELEKVEELLSFFRPTSEVGRINLLADKQPVEVEPELFELLELAVRLCQETGGAWDMTAAPLWQIWGFAKRKGRIPTAAEIEEAMRLVGSQMVELDAARNTIFFARPGMKLNFGSLGKGYAIDRCAARLLEGGMTNFLLHGGKSSILARGGEEKSCVPFYVGLPHPLCSNRRLGEIRLCNKALGTSNSRFQSFRHEGKLYGHILDPRTGKPAEGVLSATALAPTATLADALSTAFYVLGPEKSREHCDKHPEISALLIIPAAGKSNCEIERIGLGSEVFLASE